MQAKSDAQLLREYAGAKSETAFAELVHRHADLVYSAALRQAQSADLAGEIAQRVFIDLARKVQSLARAMSDDASLAGWLYRATRYTALNVLREERCRHNRENHIMQNLEATAESAPDWDTVAPLLDEAMAALNDQERDALLLRFFKNQDFRAVGLALGVSDDTAQKRVARSLEKLRATLRRKGVTTTTAALSATLATHAVQAVPVGLAAGWISVALANAAVESGAILTFVKIMSMTKLQIGFGAIVLGGLAASLAVQHQTVQKLSGENQALQQQVQTLTAHHDTLPASASPAAAAPALSDGQFKELLRLRGEVGRLREQTKQIAELREKARQFQVQVEAPKNPVGEMEEFNQHRISLVNAAKIIGTGLRIYANDNENKFPTNFGQFHNELGNVTNFPGNIPLSAFELVNVGKAAPNYPHALAAREVNPRQTPTGTWQRVYLYADGSVQVAGSPDGNFTAWEQSNTDAIPDAGQ